MSSLHLESIYIIGCISDRVHDTIISSVTIGATGNNHISGIRTRRLLQRSSLLALDSISSLVAGNILIFHDHTVHAPGKAHFLWF